MKNHNGLKENDPIFDGDDFDGLVRHSEALTEQQAADAIVASQKANGEPIDPSGAKRFVRALIAVGLFKPA